MPYGVEIVEVVQERLHNLEPSAHICDGSSLKCAKNQTKEKDEWHLIRAQSRDDFGTGRRHREGRSECSANEEPVVL